MQFLYFCEGTELGGDIAYAFEGKPQSHEIYAGPDGKAGRVWFDPSWAKNISKVRYYADRQTWQKMPQSNLWCGYYTDSPPTPSDLRRATALSGEQVVLGDGNKWEVPICRQLTTSGFVSMLPREMGLDDAGEWTRGDVVERYQALETVSWDWYRFIAQEIDESEGNDVDEPIIVEIPEAADWCLTVLQHNYRLGKVECYLLRLINDLTRSDILNATIGLPGFIEQLKKNAPVEPSHTTPGVLAETLAMPPQ